MQTDPLATKPLRPDWCLKMAEKLWGKFDIVNFSRDDLYVSIEEVADFIWETHQEFLRQVALRVGGVD
jgi:hypothetical protein